MSNAECKFVENKQATVACLQVIRNSTRSENIKIAAVGSFFSGRDCGSILYMPFLCVICLVLDKGKLWHSFTEIYRMNREK